MIDPDIRASAERDGFLTKFENGDEAVGEGYRKGFVAGEAKADGSAFALLTKERARVQILVNALKMIVDCYDFESGVGMKLEAAAALNEYEASRD